jgi:hypothetical protein
VMPVARLLIRRGGPGEPARHDAFEIGFEPANPCGTGCGAARGTGCEPGLPLCLP